MSRAVPLCVFVVVLALPVPALATHPDYEGERGIEAQVQAGVGVFATADDRVFQPAGNFTPGTTPLTTFSDTGFALRLAAGYRFAPYVSAGVALGWQSVGAANQFSDSERTLGASDSFRTLSFGVYGRFYFLSLFNGSRRDPRVFFHDALDMRRFEPWVSVGVDFVAGLRRARTYSDPANLATWSTSYVGVPVGLGTEYRVFQFLAVGLAVTLTPLVAGSTTKTTQMPVGPLGQDQTTTTTTSFEPAAASNFNVFMGLSVRYTFTF